MLEIDLHLSRDNHLVLMHNVTVDETTNGTGRIADMTLEEIKSLDAAYWWSPDEERTYPLRGKGIQIPTLQEVLDEFVDGKDIDNGQNVDSLLFLFDMKSMDAVGPTLRVIEERKIMDRVLWGAVRPSINKKVLEIKPESMACCADVKTMFVMLILYHLGLLWVYPFSHPVVGFFVDHRTDRILSRRLFDVLHGRGHLIAVFGSGLDSPEIQKKHIGYLGSDLIVTDRPDLLNQSMKHHRKSKQTDRLLAPNDEDRFIGQQNGNTS